jgi:gluconate 2-dehydrogenase gamma chain
VSTPDDTPEMMQRREILRRAAWLLGGAISAPAALAVLQGCSAKEEPGAAAAPPRFLTAAELALVAEIAEIMIPKTDTSGARDAGVPAFIDMALDGLYAPEDQARFKSGLTEFETAARDSGKPFLEQDAPARTAFLQRSLGAALSGERKPKPFILMTRELALLGYFTSKVGITENMEYVSVPTAFHGCVPLSQMKKPVYWE